MKIVICITGNGLKTQDAIADLLGTPGGDSPGVEEFEAARREPIAGGRRAGRWYNAETSKHPSASIMATGTVSPAIPEGVPNDVPPCGTAIGSLGWKNSSGRYPPCRT
jgi:hypothetical protein